MRSLRTVLCALILLTLPVSAAGLDTEAAPPTTLSDAAIAALEEKHLLEYELAAYTEEDLEQMVARVRDGQTVTVIAFGQEYEADLYVNPSFSLEVLADFPGVFPYAGRLVGMPDSSVRLTVDLDRGVLNGIIRTNEHILNVEPVLEASGPLHVWYENDQALIRLPANDEVIRDAAHDTSGPRAAHPDHEEGTTNGGGSSQHVVITGTEAGTNETGEFTTNGLPDGSYTLDRVRLRVYYDTGISPLNILNRMEDIYIHQIVANFHVLETTAISTSGWPTAVCDQNSAPFLDKFEQTYGLHQDPNSDPSTMNDKALLFTSNANIPSGLLGCAERPGTHAWAKWTGSDKQKAIIGEHELGHTFGATHDDSTFGDGHYSIMASGYHGDTNTDEQFTSTSTWEIQLSSTTYSTDYLPRVTHYWQGSDTSTHGVELTFWQIDAPRNAEAGDRINLANSWRASSGYTAIYLSERFVGARNCGDDSCNKDFGYLGGAWLYQGGEYTLRSYFLPSGGATWTFWPAYQHGGQWGPYKWHAISFWVAT